MPAVGRLWSSDHDDGGNADDDDDDDVYLHRQINLVATLALKPDCSTCSASSLLTWCENHLSAFRDAPQY